MELISAVSGVGTLIIAIVGVWIAIAQLRAERREAHASRMAEMAWQVYQAYVEPRIRTARGAAEIVSHTGPIPTTGVEYGQRYGDKEWKLEDEETIDNNMRRLLRFYNQVGILIDKKLVDEDFVFALVGPGLKTAWPGVQIAVEWYQNYYGGPSGHEKAEPRPVHSYVSKLYDRYVAWEQRVLGGTKRV